MENQKPTTSSDEIDLGQLFSKIGDFFKNIGLGVMRFLALLRRIPLDNKLAFSFIIVATMLLGISYAGFLKKDYYESTMILNSNYLNKRLIDNTVEKLNLLAGEQNKHGLAKALGISDSLAFNIIEFEAKPFISEAEILNMELLREQLKNAQATGNNKNGPIIEQVIKRMEIENRHSFELTVKSLKPTVILDLQTALVDFLKNNEYVKKRIEINKTVLQERKNKLIRESLKMDSLKKAIYLNYGDKNQQRQGGTNVILSDKTVTPLDVYSQDLNIYNEIQTINRELYLQPDFEVVDGFTEFTEPASASNAKIIVISILVGVLIAYLMVAFVSFNKYLSSIG